VVQGQKRQVLVVGEADQEGPQEGPLREIEGAPRLCHQLPPGPPLAIPKGREIHRRQGHSRRFIQPLPRAPCRRREAAAQGAVAPLEPVQRRLQGRDLQGSRKAQGRGHIVGHIPRGQLVEKPQALLGEGQGPVAGKLLASCIPAHRQG